jgi:hypothetical protein
MQSAAQTLPTSSQTHKDGLLLSALPVLFMLADGVMKLVNPPPVAQTSAQLGYAAGVTLAIGILELVCVAVYLVPPTACLGAILLTGYLGGAVASHVRIGSPFFSIVFPVMLGMLVWGGLYLRDDRLRALLPLRR